jgi:hypothetical protein
MKFRYVLSFLVCVVLGLMVVADMVHPTPCTDPTPQDLVTVYVVLLGLIFIPAFIGYHLGSEDASDR